MTNSQPQGFLAVPPTGKGPGVLVLHAWWGLNEFMRNFCDRLAQEGFVDRQDAYHAQAAQLAWDCTIAFLHDQLEGISV